MNKINILDLLREWTTCLENGKKASIAKAEKQKPDGLNGRIRRTVGKSVIFDFESYSCQQKIQSSLCKELPEFSDLIRSEPEIMDGYSWTRKDFIDLYFEHFGIIIEKIRYIVDRDKEKTGTERTN